MCRLCDKELINKHEYLINDDSASIPFHLECLDGRYFIRFINDDYDWEWMDISYCPYCGRKLYMEELNGKK